MTKVFNFKSIVSLFIIAISFIYLSVLGVIQINAMNDRVDFLYKESFIHIATLNEIDKIYHINLMKTIDKFNNEEITKAQTSLEIEHLLIKLQDMWKKYRLDFNHSDKEEYLTNALIEIKKIEQDFYTILKKIDEIKGASKLSLEQLLSLREKALDIENDRIVDEVVVDRIISASQLEKNIFTVDIIIQELISYELTIIQSEKEYFRDDFENFRYQLLILILLVFISVLSYFYLVINFHKRLTLENIGIELNLPEDEEEEILTVEYIDSLTLLSSRKFFNLIYEDKLENAKVNNSYISLIKIDIDMFAEYNKHYGYDSGNDILVQIASILENMIDEENDFVFKFDGEVFVILLTNTDEERSSEFTSRICETIRDKNIVHETSTIDNVLTVSVGMAYCRVDDNTRKYSLLAHADKMLVEAKESGQNRYKIYTKEK